MLYQAPEVHYFADGKTNKLFDLKKADIYALGMSLFVLIFGEFPKKNPSPSPRDPIYRYIMSRDFDKFYSCIKGFRKDIE